MMTLNHGFSGYVCGRALMPLIAKRTKTPQAILALAFFLGAMMPDLDVLSRLLGPGAYFGESWFSHRHATHSILGTFLLAALFAFPIAGILGARSDLHWSKSLPWIWGCLWGGGLLHIVGDLFTPRMAMPIFWPLDERIGAFSHIGWFSPYLFWMFIGALILERIVGWGVGKVPGLGISRSAAMWVVTLAAAVRWIEYLIESRFESARQWSEYQYALLPDALVAPVTTGVRAAWYWMVR